MGTTSAPPVGLAIVRVWLEDEHPAPLRASVTTIDDVATSPSDTVGWSGSDVDALLAHLRAWLDGWLTRS